MFCYVCHTPTKQLCSDCHQPICPAHRIGWNTDRTHPHVKVRCLNCRAMEVRHWHVIKGDWPQGAA